MSRRKPTGRPVGRPPKPKPPIAEGLIATPQWSVAEHVGSHAQHRGAQVRATGKLVVFRPNEVPEDIGIYKTVALFDSRLEALRYIEQKAKEKHP